MGQPPCMIENCDNWPSIGYTGVCKECIKNPELVAKAAHQMFESDKPYREKDLDASCLLSFLDRQPNGELLQKVLTLIQEEPEKYKSARDAMKEVRTRYWKDYNRKSK